MKAILDGNAIAIVGEDFKDLQANVAVFVDGDQDTADKLNQLFDADLNSVLHLYGICVSKITQVLDNRNEEISKLRKEVATLGRASNQTIIDAGVAIGKWADTMDASGPENHKVWLQMCDKRDELAVIGAAKQ